MPDPLQPAPAPSPLPRRLAILAPLALALLWRVPGLLLPPHGDHAWRDADGIGVARGFLHDGWNLFFPHIAERGARSGICGMELPLVNWLSAALMAVFGDRYFIARLPVWLSLIPLALAAWMLARRLLSSEPAARLAAGLVVLQPLVLFHSHKLMPEVPMLALVALGAAWAHDALVGRSWPRAVGAGAVLALATVLKPTFVALAAPLALWTFAALRRRDDRAGALGRAALIAALPALAALAWFSHARRLDAEYGLPLFKLHQDWLGSLAMARSPRWLLFLLERALDNYLLWTAVAAAVLAAPLTLKLLREQASLAVWLAASLLALLLWGEQNVHHMYYGLPLALPCALFAGELFTRIASRRARPRAWQAGLLAAQAALGLFQSWRFYGRVDLDVPRLERALASLGPPSGRSVVTDAATPVVSLVTLRRVGWALPASALTPAKLQALRAQGADELVESRFGGWLSSEARAALPPPRYADDQVRVYALRKP